MKTLTINGETLKVRMSHSFIQNAACPLYLKMNYVDKESTKFIRVPALRGSALHGAIEDLLRLCRRESQVPAGLTNVALREALSKNMPPEVMSEADDIFAWLRLWADRFTMPEHVVGIEERIALDDDYEECDFRDASYRGVIDLLQIRNRHAITTDWKSQANILSQTDLDQNEQLTFYCWLVSKQYPHVTRFTARIWYLRYGFYGETMRTQDDLDEFEEVLILKERKISEFTSWDPIPGKHCEYCDFIHKCPIAQDLSPDAPEVITQQQAVLAAAEVTKMEALIKTRKDALKKYVKANDEILIGDDWVYGFRYRESDSYDPADLAQVLTDFDLDPTAYMNTNLAELKKLLKESRRERPDLEEALLSIRKPKRRTEFKGYKRKAV